MVDINDGPAAVAKAKGNLTICFKNEIQGINFEMEIEKENNYKNDLKRKHGNSTDYEPVTKRDRWL